MLIEDEDLRLTVGHGGGVDSHPMKPLLLILLLAVGVSAQSPAKREQVTDKQAQAVLFALELVKTELEADAYALDPAQNRDKSNASNKVQAMYARAVKDPALLDVVISGIARDFLSGKEGARSAPQVSQVADQTSVRLQFIIIQQNARIIALLEQMARQR